MIEAKVKVQKTTKKTVTDIVKKVFKQVVKLCENLFDEDFDELFPALARIAHKLKFQKEGRELFFKLLASGFKECHSGKDKQGAEYVWKQYIECIAKCFMILTETE